MKPQVQVIEGGESRTPAQDCRGIIVGPGVNQPVPFPGYAGFVGWESPIRLRNGTWLVGFSAGYWHASPPTPLRFSPAMRENLHKMGMPLDIDAPTGGRAMLVRSQDGGKTWSKPQTLIDTPADDRHPAFLELPNGILLCSFFTYFCSVDNKDWSKDPSLANRVHILRSADGGHTWDQPRLLPTPLQCDECDGPLELLQDGSVLIATNGLSKDTHREEIALFRSTDSGQTWQLLSVVKAEFELSETSVAQLPDGRLVMISRPEGGICWSSDGGHTWAEPVSFGMRLYAPSLYVLKDGTLVCLHGSYAPGHGGLRVIFSTNGGQTWIAPAKDYGFLVDSTYGYGKAMPLPDGSLFLSYLSTGGHRPEDARDNAVLCIRLRIRPDHSGIDLLPAPNHHA